MKRQPKDNVAGAVLQDVAGIAAGAVRTVGRVSKAVGSTMRLPGLTDAQTEAEHAPPGSRPGIESIPDIDTPPPPGKVHVRCIDYGPQSLDSFEVDDLDGFFEKPRPAEQAVRWINIDGLHPNTVNRFKQKYSLHTMAAEDVLHVPQRPKVEPYDQHWFLVVRMLKHVDGRLEAEQVSFFCFEDTLITF